MAESGGPPVAETKGHLPNGLYILTNNLSRTALDLYEGKQAKESFGLTYEILPVGYLSLLQEIPMQGLAVWCTRATPTIASTISYGSLGTMNPAIRTL